MRQLLVVQTKTSDDNRMRKAHASTWKTNNKTCKQQQTNKAQPELCQLDGDSGSTCPDSGAATKSDEPVLVQVFFLILPVKSIVRKYCSKVFAKMTKKQYHINL